MDESGLKACVCVCVCVCEHASMRTEIWERPKHSLDQDFNTNTQQ